MNMRVRVERCMGGRNSGAQMLPEMQQVSMVTPDVVIVTDLPSHQAQD